MATPNLLAALGATTILIAAAPAAAQDVTPGTGVQPYVFAAAGGVSNGGATLHLGGGVDLPLWKGLGASLEGGYLGPVEAMDYGVAVLSANGFYQFRTPKRHQVTPFVTGGYSLAFRGQSVSAVNVGGGANYWLTDTLGLRVELRDHMPILDGAVRDEHLWGLRVGFTWRR